MVVSPDLFSLRALGQAGEDAEEKVHKCLTDLSAVLTVKSSQDEE